MTSEKDDAGYSRGGDGPSPVDYGTIGNIRFAPAHDPGVHRFVPHDTRGPAVAGEDGGAYKAARDEIRSAADEALRDHFAGQALPAMIAQVSRCMTASPEEINERAAHHAYNAADAMMAERARRSAR